VKIHFCALIKKKIIYHKTTTYYLRITKRIVNKTLKNLNKKVWDLSSNYDKQLNPNIDEAWVEFDKKRKSLTDTKIVKRSFLIPLSIAASLALAVGFFLNSSANQQFQNIQTADNQIENISLPDGSEMWVNENSAVSYFSSKDDERNVILDGEAYFEVASNKSKPFTVKSGSTKIKVIGTSFNVREIDTMGALEVEVKSGLVEVITGSGKIQLKKGESAIVEAGKIKKRAGNNIGGWRTKEFKFNKQSIAEILDEIQREYDVKVVFRNRDLEKCSFTTNFKNETIDNVVEVIATGFGCEVKKVNDTSFVLKGGSCR